MKGWFSFLLLLPAGPHPGGLPAQNGKSTAPPSQAALDRLEPSDRPSLPKEIAAYAVPPVSGRVSPDGPALAEWTRTADPGDVVVFTGHNLTALTGKDAGRDAEVLVYGQTGSSSEGPVRAEILRAYEEGMAVRLPLSLPPGGMILLWVRNAKGLSAPAAINRTEAWWLGPDKATRGDTVSLFGRNLTRTAPAAAPPPIVNGEPRAAGAPPAAVPSTPPKLPSGPPISWIYLRPAAGGGGIWIRPSAAHPYKVDFAVPAGFPNGEYEVWAHNGRGGSWGWSGPLRLGVDDGPGWTGAGVNVREYGAAGNGIADDTAAIQKALRSVQGKRGTLLFPPGTYLIRRGLEPGSNVRWMGAGPDKTILRCSKDFPPGSPILGGGAKNLEIRDLALEAGPEPRRQNSAINIRGSTDLRFVNVRVMNHQGAAFDIQGDRWVTFRDCDLTGGSPGFMGGASQVFLDGCTFRGMYDANSLVASWGGTGISMTRCVGRDYDATTPTGWGSGRFFVCMSHWGANRHQYFEGNLSVDLCVRDHGDQNSGEQFLWELGTNWQGVPISATPTSVTFGGDLSRVRPGDEAAVVKGKGLGQNRRVVAVEKGVITVEPPWNVPPDSTSLVVTGGFADRIVFYRNSIDGKPRGMKGTASCAINAYGCTFNLVADSNSCHETNGSFSNFGRIGGSLTSQSGSYVMPVYFPLYANNRMDTCSMGTVNFLDSGGDATLVLGAVSRKNVFVNVPVPVATYGGRGNPRAGLLNVSDRNMTERGPLPVRVD